jgi:hypothetical protein
VARSAAALSNQEAAKVHEVIEHLASALSGTTGSSVGSSTGVAKAGGGGNSSAAPAANIAELAAAIQDAVVWTEGSKTTVLKLIEDDLGQTNPKVASRVVDIVKEVNIDSEAKEAAAAAAEQNERQQQHLALHGQLAVQHLPQQQQQPLRWQSAQEQPAQHQGKQPADLHVAGPTVIITTNGSLEQQQQQQQHGLEGPVVKLQPASDDQGIIPAAEGPPTFGPA